MKTTALFCLTALTGILLFGCGIATTIRGVKSESMNKIGIGMTKEEVISAMGNPISTASPGGGIEVLRFHLYENKASLSWMEYFIRLENGKVASYGRMGDFDSTKDPTQNINVKVKEE